MKVNARNNIIRKLANSKWGCKASTLRPSCLALCYSAAEYACPVWARSTHAHKLNPALHDCCRIISGCLKPTNLHSVHLLAGIAPPHIRRTVACRMECTRQTPDTNCSITNQLLAVWSRGRASCAQSRRSTRLQAAADCGSGKTCQPPSKWDWRWPSLCRLDLERTGSVGEPLTDCAQGWAVRKQWWGDGAISMTPSRWIATAGSHRRWPPPLLPSTRRGLHGWRPGHSDWAGKGMCPQVGENCVKDTKEEDHADS